MGGEPSTVKVDVFHSSTFPSMSAARYMTVWSPSPVTQNG